MKKEKALVWFRRDLRDHDHAALSAALAAAQKVYCAFVFDRDILDALPTRHDRRVQFIRESLLELDRSLRRKGGGLIVVHGHAATEIPLLAHRLGVSVVFANRDYEPAAKARDAEVSRGLMAAGIDFVHLKDQAIFDGDEVLTQAGKPFSVFHAVQERLAEALDGGGHCRLALHGPTGWRRGGWHPNAGRDRL